MIDSGQHALLETYRGESYGARMGLSFPPLGAHACAARGPAAAGCELAAVPHSCAQQWVRSGTPHTVLNRQRPCPIRCRRHWPPLQRNAHTPARSGAESEREKREQASPKERALGCPPRATRAPRRAHRLVGLGQPGPTKRLWPHRAVAKLGFFIPVAPLAGFQGVESGVPVSCSY